MIAQIFLIMVTAIVTSALTLVTAWYVYQNYLKQRLMTEFYEKAEELGEHLKERVREGVQEGIRDGVTELPVEMVGKATKGVAKTGMDMFEDGMNLWFGSSKPRKDE